MESLGLTVKGKTLVRVSQTDKIHVVDEYGVKFVNS